jgi:transcriptional regulator with XRE-family HTH domain
MQDMNAAVALRAARRQSGLTLRGLAERAGTSHSTLAAYEAGRVTPTVDTFDRIVRAAGYAVDATLTPRVRGDERLSRGDELVQALELASMFPARHDAELPFPRFGPAPVPAGRR